MALPLTTPTFYRMPDASPAGTTIVDMLNAVYSTLTSSVDYRGTTIPSTHLWTWATGSTSGSISAIYNTAIPAGSTMTQNPTIIIAGFSGSASPTMTIDAYASSSLLVGVNKNGTTYSNWTNASPMTTGSFTGYQLLGAPAANLTTTVVRTYISQDLIFFRIIQAATTQYWAFVGAIIEPHTSYTDSLSGVARSAETDDRIYGVDSVGSTALSSNFVTSNASLFYSRGTAFLPTTSTLITVSRRNTFSAGGITGDIDFTGTFIYEKIRFLRWAGSAVVGNAAIGFLNGIFYTTTSRYNRAIVRDGTTDLYHILLYDTTTINAAAIALKAAP